LAGHQLSYRGEGGIHPLKHVHALVGSWTALRAAIEAVPAGGSSTFALSGPAFNYGYDEEIAITERKTISLWATVRYVTLLQGQGGTSACRPASLSH
jgi:hypothetical protein